MTLKKIDLKVIKTAFTKCDIYAVGSVFYSKENNWHNIILSASIHEQASYGNSKESYQILTLDNHENRLSYFTKDDIDKFLKDEYVGKLNLNIDLVC